MPTAEDITTEITVYGKAISEYLYNEKPFTQEEFTQASKLSESLIDSKVKVISAKITQSKLEAQQIGKLIGKGKQKVSGKQLTQTLKVSREKIRPISR